MMSEEQELENGPWGSEEVACLNCGHEFVAVHPMAKLLECSQCGFMNHSESSYPSPVHFIISRINDQTFLKPSRPINRMEAMGLVSEALGMLQNSTVPLISPKECSLNIVVSYFPEEVDARS